MSVKINMEIVFFILGSIALMVQMLTPVYDFNRSKK